MLWLQLKERLESDLLCNAGIILIVSLGNRTVELCPCWWHNWVSWLKYTIFSQSSVLTFLVRVNTDSRLYQLKLKPKICRELFTTSCVCLQSLPSAHAGLDVMGSVLTGSSVAFGDSYWDVWSHVLFFWTFKFLILSRFWHKMRNSGGRVHHLP